jgi:Ran GTPase-activating protein (RanGAP) involved in mRNA processing and transport
MNTPQAVLINTTLKHLNLSRCLITDAGATVLGESLLGNSSLITLHLAWNKIGAKGARALVAGLTDSPCLEAIDLSHNGLGDQGGVHMGELVRRTEVLVGALENNKINNG